MKNTANKTLSIVVPAYNVADYLDRAIESVIAARFANDIELIVIDDGSIDATGMIADLWSTKYPEIVKVIHKENGHYGTAINKGIEEATGSFFKILDADDYYCSTGLDSLISFFKKGNSPDLTITDFDYVDDNGCVQQHITFDCPKGVLLDLAELSIDPVNMHAVTFRTEILKKMGKKLDGGVPYTDVEFTLFPMGQVSSAYYLPAVVYKYSFGREEQSCSFRQLQRNIDAHRFVLDQLLSWYEGLDWDKALNKSYVEKRIGSMAIDHANICLLQSDSRQGKRLLLGLEERISRYEGIRKYFVDKKMKILRKTNYYLFRMMSYAYKMHHHVK